MTNSEIYQIEYRIESVHLSGNGRDVKSIVIAITSCDDEGTKWLRHYKVTPYGIARNDHPGDDEVLFSDIPFARELWANAVAGNPNIGILQKRAE